MKVKDLIAILERKPPESEVMVNGYESGFDPITNVDLIKVIRREDKKWYQGVYKEDLDTGDEIICIGSVYNQR